MIKKSGFFSGKAALVVAALLSLGLAGAADAQRTPAAPAGWAQAKSDLAPDPAVIFGTLPNGMRYAIMKNATPAGQVSMRLNIKAGSMHEADDQQGLAHFLEHMAFRGSKNVPEGEMFKTLERLGLAMGADTNAFTGGNATVYHFDLPKSDQSAVDAGLMLLREIASELSLTQAAMDAERGVVLAEERLSDEPARRMGDFMRTFLYQDHPIGRSPIGKVEVLRAAPVARVRAFYDAYYRPERATLIVVGDIDPADLEAKIRTKFTDWRGRGPAGGDPAPLKTGNRPSQVMLFTAEGIPPMVSMAWLGAASDAAPTRARAIEKQVEQVALTALSNRFSDIAQAPGAPFLMAMALNADQPGVARATQLTTALSTDVKGSLDSLVRTQRLAVEQGFTQEEIDRAVTTLRSTNEMMDRMTSTRRTPALAGELLASVHGEEVYLSPAQRKAIFEAAVTDLKADRVNIALRGIFAGEGPFVMAAADKSPPGGEEGLRAALDTARTARVTAVAQAQTKPWPYTDFGPRGTVSERREVADLGVTLVRFANGTRLIVKPTTFTKDEILVRVTVGAGDLDLPKDKISPAGGWSLVAGGLKDLTQQEQARTLTGRVVSAAPAAGENFFGFSGTTRPQDFELQMQLMAASVVHPSWRGENFATMRQIMSMMMPQMDATPDGAFSMKIAHLIHSGDARWEEPDPAFLNNLKLEEVRAVMEPILTGAQPEIAIVGDITVERAIEETAKTFAALPSRGPWVERPGTRDVKFPAPTPEPVKLTHKGRADQGILAVYWPTDDFYGDTRASRIARILQLVLQERLFEEIRVSQGKSYAPRTDLHFSYIFPDYGYITARLDVPPDAMPAVFRSIDTVVADLKAKEITQDELARVLGPRLEALRRQTTTNGYWLGALQHAMSDPRHLENIRTTLPVMEGVTAADVRQAAQKWLVGEKAWKIVVVPQGAGG